MSLLCGHVLFDALRCFEDVHEVRFLHLPADERSSMRFRVPEVLLNAFAMLLTAPATMAKAARVKRSM